MQMMLYACILLVMETLMDTMGSYTNLSKFSTKVSDMVKEKFHLDVSPQFVQDFIEGLIDNTFSKAQLGVIFLNMKIATLLVNPVEDKVAEGVSGNFKNIGKFIKNFKVPKMFGMFAKGSKVKVATDLIERKNVRMKQISDYNYQVLNSGAQLTKAYSQGSLVQMSKDSKQSILLGKRSNAAMNDMIQKLVQLQKVGG